MINSSCFNFEKPFKPDPLSKKALAYLRPGGHILDAGCGEGADSVFYVQNRFRVTAIDSNPDYLQRLRAVKKYYRLSQLSVRQRDLVQYRYPAETYDGINSLLVGCCMRKSEFEEMLVSLKKAVKPGGIIIMSLRNYMDPEFAEYRVTEKMIEPNTYRKKEDCCKIRYYIEEGRLRKLFADYEILYYDEGLLPDKYEEIPEHGDSSIICRRKD